MEPMDLNGGRFYARKLTSDNRIDDVPALSLIRPDASEFIAGAADAWHEDREYTWAICEQTSVELLALARLDLKKRTLDVLPAGDLDTQLPNDPVLAPKTIGDAVLEGRDTIIRWAEGFLGLNLADKSH
ncbi:hypothetical protein N24_0828 [Corynebacterium suranareeae]|uniref:Uncharacterized protein n=1 Tax=Corynebacterium suranareeae TaxID=2506452 RepID=A0A160PRY0_9CORY|nr:hypothetical protein [Corynebacterium suranareeae]BAU95090.1 hypothetical protein N24_0828 [Corynebacterium suranareeae]